jgi:hypothetical protein
MQAQFDQVVRIRLRKRSFEVFLEARFETRQSIVELLRLPEKTEYEIFGVGVDRRWCNRDPPTLGSIPAPPESHGPMLMTLRLESVDGWAHPLPMATALRR